MAPKDKELEQELKHPDQFVTFWAKVAKTAAERKKLLLGAAVALVVVAGGITAVRAFSVGRSAGESQGLARAQLIADAPLIPETGVTPSEDGLPHFKTATERLEAALKATDEWLAAHGGSKLREEAQLMRAGYLLQLGKANDALTAYQQLAASTDPRVSLLARDGLAHATEAAGQVDKALELFGALADEGEKNAGLLWDQAAFNKARLLAAKGNTAEAQKLWKRIIEKQPATPLRSEIDNRLALLESK